MTLSYYKCSLFDQTIDDYTNFSFNQEEILLKNILNNGKAEFELKNVEYKFKYIELCSLDSNKPLAIIPIKDNSKLLKFTLNNLKSFNAFEHANFIIVDDRSEEEIFNICKEYPVNYLRVDNSKGFNFSILNNIAAKIAYDKKIKQIILWNSDLWLDDTFTLQKVIDKHNKNSSTISGTKLVYPVTSWNGEEVSHNISSVFSSQSKIYRGTVQFGGASFVLRPEFKTYFPIHSFRFKDPNFIRVNLDKYSEFVTGAFQIIDLEWFIKDGGLNPSLSKNFQDVDLCLRAVEQEKNVMYFGKDLYLLHDESAILSKGKNDNQFISDNFLYSKIWTNERMNKIIYGI